MNHYQFNNCCAVEEIGGFSGEFRGDIRGYLRRRITSGKENGRAFLVATTIPGQNAANEVLAEVGFRSTDWARRGRDENNIKFWIYDLTGTAIPKKK